MQHELLCVLYPVFIHCFMDLVAKGHVQEGIRQPLSLFSSLDEGKFYLVIVVCWCLTVALYILYYYGWCFQHAPSSIASEKTMK